MSHHQVNQLIHLMWSTFDRNCVIPDSIANELLAYITAILKSKNVKVLLTSCAQDHLHLLILLPPELSLSGLLAHVKANASKWIKSKKAVDPQFSWQTGYFAVSTQESQMDSVCRYIRNDNDRHQSKNQSYTDELITMLKHQDIEYDERYFYKNSFVRILVHAVWSTNNRIPYLERGIHRPLYDQMSKVVTNLRGVVHEIGGMEDHIHLLMEVPKDQALSDLMREIKTSATHWLKREDASRFRDFEWQTGYGAFTVSLTHLEVVKNYIQCQEEHHQKHSFKEEWEQLLMKREMCPLNLSQKT